MGGVAGTACHPQARAIIEQLNAVQQGSLSTLPSQVSTQIDYAQRTNTIGSIKSDDVSRSITAPMAIASLQTPLAGAVASLATRQPQVNDSSKGIDLTELASVLSVLNERLNEPFVTVNTITGDTGIKKAQDEYEKLMKNKSPKSRR